MKLLQSKATEMSVYRRAPPASRGRPLPQWPKAPETGKSGRELLAMPSSVQTGRKAR